MEPGRSCPAQQDTQHNAKAVGDQTFRGNAAPYEGHKSVHSNTQQRRQYDEGVLKRQLCVRLLLPGASCVRLWGRTGRRNWLRKPKKWFANSLCPIQVYRNNGKEDGNYRDYRCYIGVIWGLCRGYIGVM